MQTPIAGITHKVLVNSLHAAERSGGTPQDVHCELRSDNLNVVGPWGGEVIASPRVVTTYAELSFLATPATTIFEMLVSERENGQQA